MLILLAVLFSFIIPVFFVIRREWKLKKEEEAKGRTVAREKEPVKPLSFVKAVIVLLLVFSPIFFFSSSSYRFYSADESAVKAAFKHTGKRKADCDEAGLLKKAGEDYRKERKATRRVPMQIGNLTSCPRARFPVKVELYMDGGKLLDKEYEPTGISKDMSSYVYEEFIIHPGRHAFSVKMYDRGNKDLPDYTLEDTVEVKPMEIKVMWFDYTSGRLVLE